MALRRLPLLPLWPYSRRRSAQGSEVWPTTQPTPRSTSSSCPRIQDFLRYRHCRPFPLLRDAQAKCLGCRGVFLPLAVKSSPANYDRRELIRRTWRQVRRLSLLGTREPEDALRAGWLAALVGLEARKHGDMLQGAFTFLNLTLQHLHLLKWLAEGCPRFLLGGDDDVLVHGLPFLETPRPDRQLFAGRLLSGSVPIRDRWSKQSVRPQLFAGQA